MKVKKYSSICVVWVILLFSVNLSAFSTKEASRWIDLDSLVAEFVEYADSVQPGARLGISIRSVQKDSLLISERGDEWFVPASTLKTLVTAASIDAFPLDFEPATIVALEGDKKGSAFYGNVRFYGRGDPNISGRYFSDALDIPRSIVDSIKALGIDTIYGDLLADTSYYQGPRRPKGWEKRFYNAWYGAEIAALSFNDNCYRITIEPGEKNKDSVLYSISPDVGFVRVINNVKTVPGRRNRIKYHLEPHHTEITLSGTLGVNARKYSMVLPVRKPVLYFLAAMRTAAQERNLYIEKAHIASSSPVWSMEFPTAPVLSIIDEVNQRSQNMHAEMLLRNLGAFVLKDGTSDGGILAEKIFLKNQDLSEKDFYLVDGSGLSPHNRIKPDALSHLLAKMARHPQKDLYINSLAAPRVSGATGRRLENLEEPHKTKTKTGFINNVQGLVGYIITTRGDTLAVATHLNGYKKSDAAARDLMDTIWSRLMRHQNIESKSLLQAKKLHKSYEKVDDVNQRLKLFSQELEGVPYLLGPTGEGMNAKLESKPLMNMDYFDCVTYMEHVMALAYAPTRASIFDFLQNIRYANGQISFSYRKHYFVEDWIAKNPLVKLRSFPNDTVIYRIMDKKKFFAAKNLLWNKPNPKTKIPYLPRTEALKFAESVWQDNEEVLGVGIMSTAPNICVNHVGFLILEPGKVPHFRHASQAKGMVVTQTLSSYINKRFLKSPGLLLFEFANP